MSSHGDFVHISNVGREPAPNWSTSISKDFIDHSSGQRIYTVAVITNAIRTLHSHHHLTISPGSQCDLRAFADASENASYSPHGDPSETLSLRQFIPPARRYNDENGGTFLERMVFGCYDYTFMGNKFLVYAVDGRDGPQGWDMNNYILVAPSGSTTEPMTLEEKATAQRTTDELLAACTKWMLELHNEVLVFDNGMWQKNQELWRSVQKASWNDVILEEEKKKVMIEDAESFFKGEEEYKEFAVPWKRGIIFYGPPGNGKTISIKALMNSLSKWSKPNIETLYVKTFKSFMGPEFGIRQIFLKARQMAPCLLIFEDIDSLVDVSVRSYFLNEVDGLESNHGILMIGSTNHLERLDPGIAKRPSRFDRKYFFDVPNRDERIQYSEYWRHKLRNNKKIDFPGEMSEKIADITRDFSFAYMKEAFVAALLVIVAKKESSASRRRKDDMSLNIFWNELRKQVANLRHEMEDEAGEGRIPST